MSMETRSKRAATILAFVALLAFGSLGQTMDWRTASSGGCQSSLGNMIVSATIGQGVIGDAKLGSGKVHAGFWQDFDKSYLCGDADASGDVNIADVVYVVDYIFNGGPAPSPYESGDVDCSGTINIADVVYLVNYVFVSGWPAPGADCEDSDLLSKSNQQHADVWLEQTTDDDSSSVTVLVNSDAAIQGIQLQFISKPPSHAKIAGLVAGMVTFSGFIDSLLNAGMLDVSGTKSIGTGQSSVMRVHDCSLSELSIMNAVLVDQQARPLAVTIKRATEQPALPTNFSLAQNYPNPFNPTTTISFELPKPGHMKLEVLNILGQRVRVLEDEFRTAGSYSVDWDGKNESGQGMASGIYLYRLTAKDHCETRKMVLMK